MALDMRQRSSNGARMRRLVNETHPQRSQGGEDVEVMLRLGRLRRAGGGQQHFCTVLMFDKVLKLLL